MKQWLLVFVAGLVAGVAIGMLVARGDGRHAGENGNGSGSERRLPTGAGGGSGSKSGGRDAAGARKAGERRTGGRTGQPRAAFVDYVVELKDIDDLEEVNFIRLLRQAHEITMFSEGEVMATLAVMEEMMRDDDGDDVQAIAYALVFARLAELDGPAAMEYAARLDEDIFEGDKDDLVAVGMACWADADPSGAAEWFRAHAGARDGGAGELLDDDDVQEAFFAAMVRHDPDVARELVVEGGGVIRGDAVEQVARKEASVDGLRELLESAPESEWRTRRSILGEWANRDPASAAAWLDTQDPTEGHGQLVDHIGRSYVTRDPEAGAAWVMTQEIPESEAGRRYEMVADTWASQDLAAASEWLAQQPDGSARDAAESRLAARHARKQNWEEAFQWAAGVADGRNQKRVLHEVLNAGWDNRAKEYRGNSLEAAQAAGFGPAAEALRSTMLGN